MNALLSTELVLISALGFFGGVLKVRFRNLHLSRVVTLLIVGSIFYSFYIRAACQIDLAQLVVDLAVHQSACGGRYTLARFLTWSLSALALVAVSALLGAMAAPRIARRWRALRASLANHRTVAAATAQAKAAARARTAEARAAKRAQRRRSLRDRLDRLFIAARAVIFSATALLLLGVGGWWGGSALIRWWNMADLRKDVVVGEAPPSIEAEWAGEIETPEPAAWPSTAVPASSRGVVAERVAELKPEVEEISSPNPPTLRPSLLQETPEQSAESAAPEQDTPQINQTETDSASYDEMRDLLIGLQAGGDYAERRLTAGLPVELSLARERLEALERLRREFRSLNDQPSAARADMLANAERRRVEFLERTDSLEDSALETVAGQPSSQPQSRRRAFGPTGEPEAQRELDMAAWTARQEALALEAAARARAADQEEARRAAELAERQQRAVTFAPESTTPIGTLDFLDELRAIAAGSGPPRGGASRATGLTPLEMKMVRTLISSCWNWVSMAPPLSPDTIVTLRFDMSRDGSVRVDTITPVGGAPSSPKGRQAMRHAVNALRNPRCARLPLPLDKYDDWRRLEFTFDTPMAVRNQNAEGAVRGE